MTEGFAVFSHVSREQRDLFFKEFDAHELSLQGWSREGLESLVPTYNGLWFCRGKEIMAVIVDRFVEEGVREILFLASSPKMRRNGAMKTLFRHYLKPTALKKIWLECRCDNQPALSLYQKLGFKQTGMRPGYYKDGVDALLFELVVERDENSV